MNSAPFNIDQIMEEDYPKFFMCRRADRIVLYTVRDSVGVPLWLDVRNAQVWQTSKEFANEAALKQGSADKSMKPPTQLTNATTVLMLLVVEQLQRALFNERCSAETPHPARNN